MAFRFPLAAVLRLREIEEQREERTLTEALGKVTQAREEVALLARQLVEAAERRVSGIGQSMPAADLHASYELVDLLMQHRAAAEERQKQCEALRDAQIKVYQGAHQRRELLSMMRTNQRGAYLAAQARQEQKDADDTFIARKLRR